MSFKIFALLVFVITFIASTVLYVVIGMWLEKRGRLRRWHLWLMNVLWGAACLGTLPLDFPPIGSPEVAALKVGCAVVLGAAIGAITGLFVKMPETMPPAQP